MINWLKTRIKAMFYPSLRSIQYRSHYDSFQTLREPDKFELTAHFEDVVNACINLRVQAMTASPLRLYVKTNHGDPVAKVKTKAISDKTAVNLIKARPTLASAARIEEVIDHPIINFFAGQRHSLTELLEYTQIYQDLTGSAFWYVESDGFGLPEKVYILPSQYVYTVPHQNGFDIQSFVLRMFETEKEFHPDQVVMFALPNPAFPYSSEGFSPLRACWERFKLGKLQLAYLGNYLTNQARPDAIVSPDQPTTPDNADRWAQQYADRFRQGGSGGILFLNEPLNFHPLNFPPKDLGNKDFHSAIKTGVCNCFGVPPSWFEPQNNFGQIEADQYKLAQHTILPLIKKRDEVLNNNFLPKFGEPRLFFATDDPVPENKDRELEKIKFGMQAGAISRNYYRAYLGVEPVPEGDELLIPAGMFPEDSAPIQGDWSGAIHDLQIAVYAGEMPREAAIANAITTLDVTPEQANVLFPDTEPEFKPEPQPKQEANGKPPNE